MEKLHAAQQEIHKQMASGDEDVDYSALNIKLAEVTKKLNTTESRWLQEADRLGT